MIEPSGGHLDAPASVLLPRRREQEAERLVAPLEVLDDVALDRADAAGPHYLVVRDARGVSVGVPAVGTGAHLRRATAGDGASVALLERLMDPPDGLEVTQFGPPVTISGRDERLIDVDQTNELVIVGDAVVVKWMLHPGQDGNVAAERLSVLAQAGFDGVPALRGLVRLPDGALVATVSDFIDGAEDGWTWAVDDVRAYALGLAPAPADATVGLGRLIGGMHAALATAGVSTATAAQVTSWVERADSDRERAGLSGDVADAVRDRLRPIAGAEGASLMAIHGDLHIGQILRTTTGRLLVIDFDGSPLLTAAERAEREPAARDVAGLLASLDHVGRVVNHRTPELDGEGRARVLAWIEVAQREFLDEYRRVLDDHGCAYLLDSDLLDAFQVQQECREYAYADRYLPHWRYVPDAALPALLARGRT